MKRLVSTLFRAMPNLLNVTIFLILVFSVFGIIGMQLWGGKFYNRCRTTPFPLNDTYWEISSSVRRPCSIIEDRGYQCPKVLYCGNPLDFGMSVAEESYRDPQIQFGLPTFDNFYKAF
jgi:hypothetical protein